MFLHLSLRSHPYPPNSRNVNGRTSLPLEGSKEGCDLLSLKWFLKHCTIDSFELQVITLVFFAVRIPSSSLLSHQSSCVCTKLDFCVAKLDLGILLCIKILLQLYFELKIWKLYFFAIYSS